jgi:hypothetical protein
MLWIIFGTKMDEMTGRGEICIIKELHDFYFLLSKIRLIKSRKMRLVGHVA